MSNTQIHSTISTILRSIFPEDEHDYTSTISDFMSCNNDSEPSCLVSPLSLTSSLNVNTSTSTTTTISDNQRVDNSYLTSSTCDNSPKTSHNDTTYHHFTNQKCSKIEMMLHKERSITQDIITYISKSNNICEHIMRQQTSRLLQYYLQYTSANVIHNLFMEIINYLEMLFKDTYSNYFCLKLFSYLNTNDRITYINILSHNFKELATNKTSTYPIQCIIEELTTVSEQHALLSAVIPQHNNNNNELILALALNVYGTHVLGKMLTHFPIHLMNSIITHLINNFVLLATNANGLCTVKKLVAMITNPNDIKFHLIKQTIINNAIVLCEDPYGNYVLQSVLNIWDNESVQDLMKQFALCFMRLSLQKYSSNVIEKCILEHSNFFVFAVNSLLSNVSMMNIMIHNVFGTFVLESIASCVIKSNETHIKLIGNKFFKCLQQSIRCFVKDEVVLTKWNKKIRFYTLHHFNNKSM